MFRFGKEKYAGQNSSDEGVIHFGTVHQAQIQNGAVAHNSIWLHVRIQKDDDKLCLFLEVYITSKRSSV